MNVNELFEQTTVINEDISTLDNTVACLTIALASYNNPPTPHDIRVVINDMPYSFDQEVMTVIHQHYCDKLSAKKQELSTLCQNYPS